MNQGHLFSQPLDVETRIVPVRLIVPPDTRETIASIQTLGVMQSVLLKPSNIPETPYCVVDGDRRVNSAIKFKLEDIPAIITDGTRGQIAAASAILNAARSSNPLDEARSWKTALEEGSFADIKDLAHHVRVSVTTIKKRLKLMNLPEDILIHVGYSIAEGVAERMANLAPEYRAGAIKAALHKLDQGDKFTAADFKISQTARVQDRVSSLDALFEQAPEPLLQVIQDPLSELASEVRRLATAKGIDLADLVAALGLTPLSLPSQETPPAVAATVAPRPIGRVNLGLRNSA